MDRKIGLSIYSSLDNLWVEAEGMQFIYHKFENYCSVYAGKVFTSLGIALCFAIIGLIPGLYKGHFEYVSICILFILFVSFCLSEVDASPKPNPKRKWSEIELKTLILPCVDLLLILLYLMVSTPDLFIHIVSKWRESRNQKVFLSFRPFSEGNFRGVSVKSIVNSELRQGKTSL